MEFKVMNYMKEKGKQLRALIWINVFIYNFLSYTLQHSASSDGRDATCWDKDK